MKMFRILFMALLIPQLFWAQEDKVERLLVGSQIGLIGAELYGESRLNDQIALRTELALMPGIWGGFYEDELGFALYPSLALQPKYYYNIASRAEKGKNTLHNAANYIGLQMKYIPDWFLISNKDNVSAIGQFHVIPTFGFRRNFGMHFNYEFKIGLGYGTYLDSEHKEDGAVLDLGFKVGYDFYYDAP